MQCVRREAGERRMAWAGDKDGEWGARSGEQEGGPCACACACGEGWRERGSVRGSGGGQCLKERLPRVPLGLTRACPSFDVRRPPPRPPDPPKPTAF